MSTAVDDVKVLEILKSGTFDHDPGYRAYYTFRNKTLVLLLCGGTKSTQVQDIKLAQQIAAQWEDQQ